MIYEHYPSLDLKRDQSLKNHYRSSTNLLALYILVGNVLLAFAKPWMCPSHCQIIKHDSSL